MGQEREEDRQNHGLTMSKNGRGSGSIKLLEQLRTEKCGTPACHGPLCHA